MITTVSIVVLFSFCKRQKEQTFCSVFTKRKCWESLNRCSWHCLVSIAILRALFRICLFRSSLYRSKMKTVWWIILIMWMGNSWSNSQDTGGRQRAVYQTSHKSFLLITSMQIKSVIQTGRFSLVITQAKCSWIYWGSYFSLCCSTHPCLCSAKLLLNSFPGAVQFICLKDTVH